MSVTKGNPGKGAILKVGFSNDQRSWEEHADLIALLAKVLADQGQEFRRDGDLLASSSGLTLMPQFVSLDPQYPKGTKTCSTIEFAHPRLGDARPFEYQHSAGDDINHAFTTGFESWAQLDLPAILDALRPQPTECNVMMMTFPPNEAHVLPLERRVVLGPTAHFAKRNQAVDTDHPFCPCCLLTNSFDAFSPFLEAEGVFAIRMFVSRNADGLAEADCRVNGEDFEAGKSALAQYAATWPARGFEYRKQYMIVQPSDADDGA